VGPWKIGVGIDGPAAKASWTIGDDAKIRVGAGFDWQGQPHGGVHIQMRF